MHTFSLAVLIRRLILITLLALPQSFWFRRGWKLTAYMRPSAWKWAGRIFLGFAAIAIVLVFSDRIFQHYLPPSVSKWIAPIVLLWIFTSIFAFLCVKVVHTVEWIWNTFSRLFLRRNPDAAEVDWERRSFFRYAACFVGAMPFLAALYGFGRERLNFEVVRVDVPIAGLPPTLDGLRIVQLSDIHVGDFMPPAEIRRAVDMANALDPHLAVITGDLVSDHGDPLADCVAELSHLQAPLGIWGCNGNHEIYAAAEDAAEACFRKHGMNLLRGTSTELSWNGEQFNLIGVDYQRDVQLTGLHVPHLHGVEALVRRDMPNILLSHNPNSFYRAAEMGIELTLSGHTHGGQITVEIVNHSISPARFMTRFIAGLYRLPLRVPGMQGPSSTGRPVLERSALHTEHAERAYLYVNRGLGTLGIPARLGAAPEITLLTLRSARS